MKSCKATLAASLLLASATFVSARDNALHYKFSAGQTNAFAVEISVISENGSDKTTGNVILVTKDITSNSVTLICRGSFKLETKHSQSRPGFYPGFYPGNMMQTLNVFPYDCEVELDLQGNEIRDGGDYVMAAPLGKLVQSLFLPLPAKSSSGGIKDRTSVLDAPYWLGPAESFLTLRQNGQPMMSMNYYYMGGQKNPMALLTVARQTEWQIKDSTPEQAEIHAHTDLQSPAMTGGQPRLKAATDSDLSFDRNLGMLSLIEMNADISSQSETSSRHARASFKAHLLTGNELAAALAPPPPPAPPRKLSGADLNAVIADLKSPDIETRRAAMRRLNGADVDSPSPELMDAIEGMALDADTFVRMTAANFISNHATTNEVPILIKLLKGSDWSVRQPAIKALGRLNDSRAAQPLVDLIARNGNMFSSEVSSALINLGAPAEKAVLGLMNDRNVETQRLACTILQQIGTDQSVEALQKLVADDEQSVSQAAAEAIRAIKQRQ